MKMCFLTSVRHLWIENIEAITIENIEAIAIKETLYDKFYPQE